MAQTHPILDPKAIHFLLESLLKVVFLLITTSTDSDTPASHISEARWKYTMKTLRTKQAS